MNEDMMLFYILLSGLIGAIIGVIFIRTYYELIGLLESIKDKYRSEKYRKDKHRRENK